MRMKRFVVCTVVVKVTEMYVHRLPFLNFCIFLSVHLNVLSGICKLHNVSICCDNYAF